MPKVQIEIDLPNSCGECPFCHWEYWCILSQFDCENYLSEGAPNWCPLHKKYKQDEENFKKQVKEYASFLADCSTLPLWNNPKAKQVFDDWMEKVEKENNV